MPPFFLTLLLISFSLSFALTYLVRKRLLAKAVMDIPNERSMHKVPVPRGGGLAVMVVIILGLVLGILAQQLPWAPALFLLISLALLMIISWLDDKRGTGVKVRLVLHLTAATLGSFALGENALVFGSFLPFWLDRLVVIIGWAWFMNLYNFMDGIDGITGAQSISSALGALILFIAIGAADPSVYLLSALIMGSCLGFLMLNWHPAKIFLGDVGSVPLGFLIGFLLLKLAATGPLIAAALIPLYYLADSGITITKRFLRGEKIWQAHRQHFYQVATVGEKNPIPVVLWIICANLGLIGAALLSLNAPWLGLCLGVVILLLLLAKMSHSARKALQQ